MATAAESTADQSTEHAPVTADEESLTAVLLDPDTIVRDGCNAREHDTEPDEDLINSVKAVEVQDPISVQPRPDGTYGAFRAGGAPRPRRSPTPPPRRTDAPSTRSRRSSVPTW